MIEEYIELLVHTALKIQVYRILVKSLEDLDLKYRIKEPVTSKDMKTQYTVYTDPYKNKAIDLEINKNTLKISTYVQLCINRFIPLRSLVEIKLSELQSLLIYTITRQQSVIKLSLEN